MAERRHRAVCLYLPQTIKRRSLCLPSLQFSACRRRRIRRLPLWTSTMPAGSSPIRVPTPTKRGFTPPARSSVANRRCTGWKRRDSTRSGPSPNMPTSWRSNARQDRWLIAPRPALGPKVVDDQRAAEGHADPDAGADGRARPHRVPPDQRPTGSSRGGWGGSATASAELAKRYVDHMVDLGDECDFFTDVAMHYPLYMILSILGLPEEDFPRMLEAHAGDVRNDDPELARDRSPTAMQATLLEFFEYFQSDHRGSAREPDRRSRVGHRQRRDRRRTDRCPRGSRLLRDHRDRGPRHDERHHRRRAARAHRTS